MTPYAYLQNPPSDIIWEKVIDREAIDAQIFQYNQESFLAAVVSPMDHGLIHDELTFTSLLPVTSALLQGHIPSHWPISEPRLQSFLASFTIPEAVHSSSPISTDASKEDVSKGFKRWRLSMTTSPSGRHLGHYKAIISDPMLLGCLSKFLHIALNSGIALTRWQNAVNVMLEKDPGVPNVNCLSIIHLFEADYNFLIKLLWGH